jgi:DNA-binding MarR family transcriptional regulator
MRPSGFRVSAERPRVKRALKATTSETIYPVADSLGFLMRSTLRGMRQLLRTRLRAAGIDLGVWFYLRVLWEEDGLTQAELTKRVGDLQPSSVAALRPLDHKELVRLEKDADDKRKIRIFLTAKGRAKMRLLMRDTEDVNEGIALAGFSPQEAQLLRQFLRRIRTNVTTEL